MIHILLNNGNKIFEKFFIFLILIISISSSIYSQKENLKSPFLSIHTGGFLSYLDNFDKTYDSQLGFVYGLGAGLPVSTRSYIYGKATLFSKTGTPIIRTYYFDSGELVSMTEKREGIAEYDQWIINAGFLYNFFLNPDWILGINAGITYSIISEKQKNKSGERLSSIEANGVIGFFTGGIIEKNFDKSPFSIFFEFQLNFSRNDVLEYVGNYGGINSNLGIRYYFKERRVE